MIKPMTNNNPAIPFISQMSALHSQAWLKQLNKALPEETIKAEGALDDRAKQQCKIAIVANPDPDVLALYSSLNWVQSLWAGIETLIQPSIQQGFKLVRLVDPTLAETMAEAVLAWTLYLHRRMPSYASQQRQKEWQELPYLPANQCNVGVLGLGELGQASAARLSANGFTVYGWSTSPKKIANVTSYAGAQGLHEILSQSDILICLLPLTPETHGIINNHTLKKLPQGASLINFSRGPIVVLNDLIQHLDSGNMYHGVLDVFDQEPLPETSKLWHHPKITVLPHISASTNPQSAIEIVASNIRRYRAIGHLDAFVDPKKGY